MGLYLSNLLCRLAETNYSNGDSHDAIANRLTHQTTQSTVHRPAKRTPNPSTMLRTSLQSLIFSLQPRITQQVDLNEVC